MPSGKVTIDFETRSQIDLRKVGAHRYAADPTTEVLCLAARKDQDDPVIWINDKFNIFEADLPLIGFQKIVHLIRKSAIVEAHNAEFEYAIWNECLTRYGAPPLPLEQFRCSAAMAAAMGLPRSLKDVAKCLGSPIDKDMGGHKLMLKMCKPRASRKAEREAEPDRDEVANPYWWEEPEDIIRLAEYCLTDIEAEEWISDAMPCLSPDEQAVWLATARMNQRGVQADLASCLTMETMVINYKEVLQQECQELTGVRGTQTTKLLAWLNEHADHEIPNIQKETLEQELLKDDAIRRAELQG